jgi:hypothetical protein
METLVTNHSKVADLSPIADRRRSAADRRREIRMASRSAAATLCVGAREPMEVQIRDISRSGMGLTTPCALRVGSSVAVQCGALTINATVRHCRERVSGEYSVGISIDRILNYGAGTEI